MPYENRARDVAEVSGRLKRLAFSTNAAIVATAQLSTNPGRPQSILPLHSLSGLRASGTIAHVADHVRDLQPDPHIDTGRPATGSGQFEQALTEEEHDAARKFPVHGQTERDE
ncbi:DnaB-like helicase C-terminal domain-containing protein [Kibdelosporangium aridum]|uniref:DnaB-like helicase C-terminal domain-containing protein n=1 Tax=Kibdelosporangium aridum TaxID=2030 RepID=UPI0035EBBD44